MSCGVGHRLGLDSTLLWLWHRLAAAAQIQPLAWELPYAASVAQKKQERKVQFCVKFSSYKNKNWCLLQLWYRPEATAPIRPLAWEPPYAADVALKRRKTKN